MRMRTWAWLVPLVCGCGEAASHDESVRGPVLSDTPQADLATGDAGTQTTNPLNDAVTSLVGSTACESYRRFFGDDAHRTCAGDADCTVLGSCSTLLGPLPVNVASQAAGSRLLSINTLCKANWRKFKDPRAVCERGWCQLREAGGDCSPPPPNEPAGKVCPPGQESYAFGGSPSAGCSQHCSGPRDASCPAGTHCSIEDVAVPISTFGEWEQGWQFSGSLVAMTRFGVLQWLCTPDAREGAQAEPRD